MVGRRAAAILVGIGGLCFFGEGGYIYAKALLAQALLQNAWERTQAGESEARPWSWADTHPVARLRAPRHGIDQIVLSGASGRTLAFAPGHVAGSARPGTDGNTVVGGHRDTHFAFLERVERGDLLELEGSDGRTVRYRVTKMSIADHRDLEALESWERGPVLTLVTCYPFGAVVPGGPLRYVVQAKAEAPFRDLALRNSEGAATAETRHGPQFGG